jgi:hypothetical protein
MASVFLVFILISIVNKDEFYIVDFSSHFTLSLKIMDLPCVSKNSNIVQFIVSILYNGSFIYKHNSSTNSTNATIDFLCEKTHITYY